ncbi:MAG: TetR family transcriptional regulator [Brasilonema octagenarum HA4186-MV1]|jgi:AcrR family transcriptional regulator|uniref:TetR/AcrR family transcriptional regulator n=1 Tax=Brasilonema octagenarum UFV-OR1 TaxID=417115 RepID=A0ABX1M813_9CYAN|nr:TetR/AcrR family transcriptional regulator [Brasilonema octagenarum]MBW4627124.1 TetR family transcriptional regulator [Brasilonema octagenarum HA4186-MV1]NMF63861.1 TetR/AcrR family transcriptional regulator [Brasilonema octagenarum UFV-OR1]
MKKIVVTPTTDTKEQIISVAERLFAERGFSGTTLRNVVSEARVNLAAVHYHFGSKEDLFRAVVARFARPVVEQELALLEQLQAGNEVPSVEAILTALLKPCLEILAQDKDTLLVRAQFMGRCRTEPEPIKSIATDEFAVSSEAFLDVLQRALPEQSRSQLHWKLDLVIAALIRVQTEAGQPFALLQMTDPEHIQNATEQLVKFLSPGMRS